MFGNPNNSNNNIESNGPPFIVGRVTNIILGPYKSGELNLKDTGFTNYSDIGKISFEILYSPNNIPSDGLISKPAYPIFPFFKQYPLIGEIVNIITGPSIGLNDNFSNQNLYYFPPYNVWNSVNHNVFPNLAVYAKYAASQNSVPGYNNKTIVPNVEIPKGYSFKESKDIRQLTPFEGDAIIESRFGQSIRFGSTNSMMQKFNHWSSNKDGKNGSPITIIRNGQGKPSFPLDPFATTVEDINSDLSSIYLTSDQSIIIEDIKSFPLDSFPSVVIESNIQNTILSYQPITSTEATSAADQDSQVIGLI